MNNNKRSVLKKNVILNGAHNVFARKGFLSATMQDVINECGISRGGIYLYFNSIDDVFFETVTQRSVRQFDDIRETIKQNPPFEQILNNYLLEQKTRLLNHMHDDHSLLRAMYEYSFTHNHSRDRGLKQKQINTTRATVRSLFDLGVKQNKIVDKDIKIIADNFMLLIEGMNVLALTGELTEKQIDDQFNLFVKMSCK
ncbi:TetR/AcrR family transcriptional regulator [Lactiplantibacillus plantarum]|nr:TetR/AcrR family transcriptional regulator [Lactiplantibacillus plantarum]